MVPYLYNDLLNIIKKIINLIVKPDIMINWIHDADLIYVNMSIKSNFIKPKDMNVGFSTVAAFVDLSKKDLVTKKKIADFFPDIIFFPSLLNRKYVGE